MLYTHRASLRVFSSCELDPLSGIPFFGAGDGCNGGLRGMPLHHRRAHFCGGSVAETRALRS